jgi:NAD(P)-dependent dehydrogenase (short-subunit alcohol dehydrogenase family)
MPGSQKGCSPAQGSVIIARSLYSPKVDKEHQGMNEDSLTGQVAMITGGGRGLGRSIAQALAEAGATVALAARTTEQLAETIALVEQQGGRALAFPVDVTDQEAVQRMVAEVEQQLGAVDLLINNAGIVTPLGPIWEVDPDEWWRALDINLRGSFLCARAVLPGMIARHRGRILNMASGAGLNAIAYGSAYVVSKTALIRFTENLAAETREYGISAFAIEPGTARTVMSEYLYSSEAGQKWLPWFRRIFDEGRDVPVAWVTRLILSLASGFADPLSGCTISVHDDLPALVNRAAEIKQDKLYSLQLRKLLPQAP